jgi:hypothetical protein
MQFFDRTKSTDITAILHQLRGFCAVESRLGLAARIISSKMSERCEDGGDIRLVHRQEQMSRANHL